MSSAMVGKRDDATPFVLTAPATTGGTLLTGEWWNQPGLLPTSPQSSFTAAGRDAAGNCKLNLNNRPLVAVPPGSLVFPDTTRAFAVLANCSVEPLITLPVQPGTTQPPVTTSGGWHGIGNAGSRPNPNIDKASATVAYYATAAILSYGIGVLLNHEIQKRLQAKKENGVIALPPDTGTDALANRNAMGMDAEQFGKNVVQQYSSLNSDDCREQWERAAEICEKYIGGPNEGITGSYKNYPDCMRGLVSEECRGNNIDWGPKGRPPSWMPL